MKITFLGTSHGVPAADRFCSCAMIEAGGRLYFIDAGVPMVDMILRYGKRVEDAKAVFTTHAHGDHIGRYYWLRRPYKLVLQGCGC